MTAALDAQADKLKSDLKEWLGKEIRIRVNEHRDDCREWRDSVVGGEPLPRTRSTPRATRMSHDGG